MNAPEKEAAAIGVLGILLIFWLWGSYWRGGISTDEDGITQQSLFGRRQMTWGQMREFRWLLGSEMACVSGTNRTVRFWKGIGDSDRLADEITAHLDTTY